MRQEEARLRMQCTRAHAGDCMHGTCEEAMCAKSVDETRHAGRPLASAASAAAMVEGRTTTSCMPACTAPPLRVAEEGAHRRGGQVRRWQHVS